MAPDNEEWLAQVRRRIDAAKVTVSSNGRLDESARVALASDMESVFKRCRALVQETA